MIRWKNRSLGVYDLYINGIDDRPIATIKDCKVHCPQLWKNRMMETPKSFEFEFKNYGHSRLTSENIDDAKKELESIIVEKCKGIILTIPDYHKQLDDWEDHCRGIVNVIITNN